LKDGEIRIESKNASLDDAHKDKFTQTKDGKLSYIINSGTLELNNNKVIILAD
jgi:F-type H+-transporting ATPase subunit epsilon